MLKWGARIDPQMQKSAIKVMVVLGGVEFASYTESGMKDTSEKLVEEDLDKIFE